MAELIPSSPYTYVQPWRIGATQEEPEQVTYQIRQSSDGYTLIESPDQKLMDTVSGLLNHVFEHGYLTAKANILRPYLPNKTLAEKLFPEGKR
jgi:hypothetical protein